MLICFKHIFKMNECFAVSKDIPIVMFLIENHFPQLSDCCLKLARNEILTIELEKVILQNLENSQAVDDYWNITHLLAWMGALIIIYCSISIINQSNTLSSWIKKSIEGCGLKKRIDLFNEMIPCLRFSIFRTVFDLSSKVIDLSAKSATWIPFQYL